LKETYQKGGTFISKSSKYLRTKLLKLGEKVGDKIKYNTSRGNPTRFDQAKPDHYRELLENQARKGKDSLGDPPGFGG
jgi:hypothetical protein